MSAPSPLTEIPLPDWVDELLTGAGAPGDTTTLGQTAVASDVLGAIGNGPAALAPFLNPLGGLATYYAQQEQSIARNGLVRFVEAFTAGVVDMGLGSVQALPGPLQPLLPVVDALVLAPASRKFGARLGIAENINGLLRGLAATIDARVPGGGGVESEARGRARAETGDMGELTRLLTSLWHTIRGTAT